MDYAVFDLDLGDRSPGANLGSSLLSGFGHGLSDRAHSADGKEVVSGGIRICCGAEQEHEACSGRPGSKKRSEDAASGDSGPQQISLEKFRGQIGNRHWGPAQQVISFFLSQPTNGTSELQQTIKIAFGWPRNFGRCKRQGLRNHA